MRVYHEVASDDPELGVRAGDVVSYDESDPLYPFMVHKEVSGAVYYRLMHAGALRPIGDPIPVSPLAAASAPVAIAGARHGRPRLTLVRASA